eukprot:RCo041930
MWRSAVSFWHCMTRPLKGFVLPRLSEYPHLRCGFVVVDFVQLGVWWHQCISTAQQQQQEKRASGSAAVVPVREVCEVVTLHAVATGAVVGHFPVGPSTTFLELLPDTVRGLGEWVFLSGDPAATPQ